MMQRTLCFTLDIPRCPIRHPNDYDGLKQVTKTRKRANRATKACRYREVGDEDGLVCMSKKATNDCRTTYGWHGHDDILYMRF